MSATTNTALPPEEGQAPKNKDGKFTIFRKNTEIYPLPDYGLVYFDHLKAEYENNLKDDLSPETKSTIKELNEKRRNYPSKFTWSDVYTYESIFLRNLQECFLPRKVWALRNRYREIIGLKEYEAYLASKPPEITGLVKAESLRADIEFLLSKIYLHYSLNPFYEKMRSAISKKVTIVAFAGIALIIITAISIAFFGVTIAAYKPYSATILIVLFAGAMGGLMSMLQRYNSLVKEGDPIISLTVRSWYQIFTPAINGALFAVLLYIIFRGDLILGGIFPSFTKASQNGSGLTGLLTDSNPAGGTDYAKLIIWSFIAGFAERFVPDTLTKIISKRDIEKEVKVS